MSEVTTDDLKRVYDKMEAADSKLEEKLDQVRTDFNEHTQAICQNLAQMSTSVAVMAERFKQMTSKVDDIPDIPERPCQHFETHIAEHKEKVDSWRKPLIVGAIVTAFLFIQEPIKAFIAKVVTGGP